MDDHVDWEWWLGRMIIAILILLSLCFSKTGNMTSNNGEVGRRQTQKQTLTTYSLDVKKSETVKGTGDKGDRVY